jgi:putative transposase
VVANGYAKQRTVTTGAGQVEVKAPRVDDRREGEHYRSAILPPYMRAAGSRRTRARTAAGRR